MHIRRYQNWGPNDLVGREGNDLGGNVLGGNGIGGETTKVWGTKRLRVKINWFRCYHTRCDNRHRILSRWFQLDYWFFELANQTQRYIKFEYRKINNHCFSLKINILFFLTFWKQYYKINQIWNNLKKSIN